MARTRHQIACVILLVLSFSNAAQSETATQQKITLAFTGDVYIDAPTRNTLKSLSTRIGRAQAYQTLLAEVASTLRAATVAVVNLETPIAPRYRERNPGEPPIFTAHHELLDALVDAGVDVITLANNHAYDQGIQGLRETLTAAHQRGLATVGIAPTVERACGPLLISTPIGDLGLCGWTQSLNVAAHDAPNQEVQPDASTLHVAITRDGTLNSCLARARELTAFAIAVLHFTPTSSPDSWLGPGETEREIVSETIAAGAELVIGHGPHIPGFVERLPGVDGAEVLVVYSLGNLVGAMGQEGNERRTQRAGVRDAPILTLSLQRTPEGRLTMAHLRVTPFWIADAMPQAPWWTEHGGQPLTRPLSIARELRRLAESNCGHMCDYHARTYRQRARLLATAMGVEPNLTEPPSVTAESTSSRPSPDRAQESEIPPPSSSAGIDGLAQGVTLPVRFQHNRVVPEVTDEEEMRRLAQLLLHYRDLHIEIIGSARDDEDLLPPVQLGSRRARAVMWILSRYGPSRGRFVIRGEGPNNIASVVLRTIR